MRSYLIIGFLLAATRVFADVSVVASVDRNRIGFGESVTLTVAVQGAHNGEPSIPRVDGLTFNGPSTSTSFSFVNGQTSQSISYTYQVTPGRTGEFTIPAIGVDVGGKNYLTTPINLIVEKSGNQGDLGQTLFGRVKLSSQQVYIGQTAPLDVFILSRTDVPLRGLSGFNYEADGLGYKFLPNLKSGSQIINGESVNVQMIQGAISPTTTGAMNFGPCIVKAQLAVPNRGGNSLFDDVFGRTQVREVPITIDPVPITVLPLPEEGRPTDFSGAVGRWNLEVTAKPTEVAVGDPITFIIKISGSGNIDTVPTPKLGSLDEFKTYEPTTKTTKDELNTAGERVIQQVLIARSPEIKQLPEVRLVYFDPVAKAYKTAVQAPMKLVVKAGSGGQSTIVSGGNRLRPDEKLGQDIVYLKGDLGPLASATPFCATPTFWALNTMPVLALLGGIGWKKRTDKFRGNIAYARRVRAAKDARKLLAIAANYDEVQHALQNYLGDRLNIPAAGITASIVEEQLLPRGVNGELAADLKACFEACDTARFAGGSGGAVLAATREKVERLIDELEKTHL
ncbi:MAG TPA: BatD family protein [Verrucomicrobiae bacterium]|nr:BatD family protein [Verrucomicrobiae bacterium]